MALTVVKRPQGKKLSATAVVASVSSASGDALFTAAAHGLTTADFIYIISPRTAYNGYWYVEVITVNTFKLREYATAGLQAYVNSGNVTYYKSLIDVPWNAVHLPIVYKLKSDKWPVNSVDTARTVSSFANSNGYTELTISGDIKASGSADALEQVVITGTTSLNGVYKILSWSSDVKFVIDLSYVSTNSFAGGSIQYYYGNYHAIIKIYAGLATTHYWASYKPYALVGTIEQVPDSLGIITFNVNEFLKKQINILDNNLLLDTLPNNVDAFCYFYISVAESYDDANQYGTGILNVSEYVGPYTNDTELLAINADLPFKSKDSGFMTPYVSRRPAAVDPTATFKWLTGFEQPTLFVGKYFDVSYIMNEQASDAVVLNYIQRDCYNSSDVLLGSFQDVQTNMDKGVYRYQVQQSAFLESYIKLTFIGNGTLTLSEVLRININIECANQEHYITWLNNLGGFDYWNFTGQEQTAIDILESKTQEKNIFTSWPKSYGETADSIEKQTVRRSKDILTVRSQYLESIELDGVVGVVSSPLVQEINSIYDKRTLIIESATLPKKEDNQKLLMVSFNARYTDEKPAQGL